MGAQGYVRQLGGSYLSVDLISGKRYHFITVEQSQPSASQGLGGVCRMWSNTIDGKEWLPCPEKGWKATLFFHLSCPRDRSGKVRGRCIPPWDGEEGGEVFFLSFITSMVGEKL